MKTLTAALVLSLVLCPLSLLEAQRTETRFEPLVTALTSAPQTYTLPPRAMIGQTQHTFTILLADAPSQTCVGGFVDVYAEGSYDNSNWFRIGEPLTSIQTDQYGSFTGTLRADIPVPFLRLQVSSFDTTNCTLSAFYSGTLSPVTAAAPALLYPLQVMGPSETIAQGTPTENVIQVGAYTTHRVAIDASDCSGYSFSLQLQYAWDDDGPWLNIGYLAGASSATTLRSPYAYGKFPLIRGVFTAATTTGVCNTFTIYYWGTNEDYSGANDTSNLLLYERDQFTTGSVTTVTVADSAVNNHCIMGMVLSNACSSGVVTLETTGGVDIAWVGPGQTISWPLQANSYYCTTQSVGAGIQITGASLPADACVNGSSLQLWYKQTGGF